MARPSACSRTRNSPTTTRSRWPRCAAARPPTTSSTPPSSRSSAPRTAARWRVIWARSSGPRRGCPPSGSAAATAECALQLTLAHGRAAFDVALLGALVELGLGRAGRTSRTTGRATAAGAGRALLECAALRRTAFLLGFGGLPPTLLRFGLAQIGAVLLGAVAVRRAGLAERNGDRLLAALDLPARAAFQLALLVFVHHPFGGGLLTLCLRHRNLLIAIGAFPGKVRRGFPVRKRDHGETLAGCNAARLLRFKLPSVGNQRGDLGAQDVDAELRLRGGDDEVGMCG